MSQFDFRSRLKTWAYRVAVNYILDTKKSAIERLHLSFERFAEDLESGLQPAAPDDTEHSVLIEEVKVACTMAMLQCLDRPHRLAYVLGELMELSGPEAAEALAISPALFRKRLQHAREAILEFTKAHCGLVSDSAACRCHRRVSPAAVAGPKRSGRCKEMKGKEWAWVIAGHGIPVPGPEYFSKTIDYFTTLGKVIKESPDVATAKDKMIKAYPGHGGVPLLDLLLPGFYAK